MKTVQVENITVNEFEVILGNIVNQQLKPIQDELNSLSNSTTYSVKQVAEKLNLTPGTVNRMCKEGLINAKKSPKNYIITHTNYKEYLTSKNQ